MPVLPGKAPQWQIKKELRFDETAQRIKIGGFSHRSRCVGRFAIAKGGRRTLFIGRTRKLERFELIGDVIRASQI